MGAQQHLHLVLRFVEQCRVERDGVVTDALARAVHLEIHLDGDPNEVISGLPEDAAELLRCADYFERPTVDGDDFANRVHSGEELFAQIVANHRHRGAPAVFAIDEKAASISLDVRNRSHVGRITRKLHVFHLVILVTNPNAAIGIHSDLAGVARVGAQEFVFLTRQFRIFLEQFQQFLGFNLPEYPDASDSESASAHVGDLLCDVDVHAVNHAHYRDQRRGSQDDAEQREKAAELTRPERAESDLHGFHEGGALGVLGNRHGNPELSTIVWVVEFPQ